jgi:hypothetical protein
MCGCSKLSLNENHGPNQCPVDASFYCSICQENGHPTLKCPDRATWHYRKPEFIEQLIPISVLNHYNIKSLTPIGTPKHEHIPYIHDPVIEIPYDKDGKNIRATLAAHNIPSSSVKENERVANVYGDFIGKPVSIINQEPVVPNEKPVKSKAKTKLVTKK